MIINRVNNRPASFEFVAFFRIVVRPVALSFVFFLQLLVSFSFIFSIFISFFFHIQKSIKRNKAFQIDLSIVALLCIDSHPRLIAPRFDKWSLNERRVGRRDFLSVSLNEMFVLVM